jgi:ribosomal protein RSM22 (predicted rRNA methylase)
VDLSYETLKKLLLNPNLTESDIVRLLDTISKNFTINRDAIGLYSDSVDMASAYTAFYLPTNFPKLSFVLNQLDKSVLKQIKGTTIIDVGSGPGTYALAFKDYFGSEFQGPLIIMDQSMVMLDQASKVMNYYFPDFKNVRYQNNLNFEIAGETTLFFGNSINELGFEKLLELLNKIKPKFLFFIEPGTKQFFQIALKIRNEIDKRGGTVIYPCPSLISGCPLEQKNDWCHQILRTKHHPSIERLSQLIQKDRRSMPFISHLYLLNGENNKTSGPSARLIRFLKETKFAFIWEVCLEENGKIQTKRFEVLTKNLSKIEFKELKKISIGINVDFEVVKKISPDIWRVELKNFKLS